MIGEAFNNQSQRKAKVNDTKHEDEREMEKYDDEQEDSNNEEYEDCDFI